MSEASTIKKALEMRAKQYDRNFVGTAQANYVDSMRIPTDTLREAIRAVASEELQTLLAATSQP